MTFVFKGDQHTPPPTSLPIKKNKNKIKPAALE